jgi:hypothetical protein
MEVIKPINYTTQKYRDDPIFRNKMLNANKESQKKRYANDADFKKKKNEASRLNYEKLKEARLKLKVLESILNK